MSTTPPSFSSRLARPRPACLAVLLCWLALIAGILGPIPAQATFSDYSKTPKVIAPPMSAQVPFDEPIKLEIAARFFCGNDPVNRHDPLGLADETTPGFNPWLAESYRLMAQPDPSFGDRATAAWLGLWGTLRGVGPAVTYTADATHAGMAQARVNINRQIDSGEIGAGPAIMARGLQFVASGPAAITFAPVHPVDTAVGIATAPVTLPLALGTSIGDFGVDPSWSGGFDVLENGANVALLFDGASALQSRFPALQNMRVPSLTSFQLRPTWNPLNYRPDLAALNGPFGFGKLRYVGPDEGLEGLTIKTGREQGREFRIDKLQTYEFDPKQPAYIRGWLRQERLRIEAGRAIEPRNPPGFDQSHLPGRPAREGYDYNNSTLNLRSNNLLEELVRRKLGLP